MSSPPAVKYSSRVFRLFKANNGKKSGVNASFANNSIGLWVVAGLRRLHTSLHGSKVRGCQVPQEPAVFPSPDSLTSGYPETGPNTCDTPSSFFAEGIT